jgi:hypothetical protein
MTVATRVAVVSEGGGARSFPVLVVPAVVFLVIGVATDDLWAYVAGGALLLLATLQWSRV